MWACALNSSTILGVNDLGGCFLWPLLWTVDSYVQGSKSCLYSNNLHLISGRAITLVVIVKYQIIVIRLNDHGEGQPLAQLIQFCCPKSLTCLGTVCNKLEKDDPSCNWATLPPPLTMQLIFLPLPPSSTVPGWQTICHCNRQYHIHYAYCLLMLLCTILEPYLSDDIYLSVGIC